MIISLISYIYIYSIYIYIYPPFETTNWFEYSNHVSFEQWRLGGHSWVPKRDGFGHTKAKGHEHLWEGNDTRRPGDKNCGIPFLPLVSRLEIANEL